LGPASYRKQLTVLPFAYAPAREPFGRWMLPECRWRAMPSGVNSNAVGISASSSAFSSASFFLVRNDFDTCEIFIGSARVTVNTRSCEGRIMESAGTMSSIVKHSVAVGSRKTSISLEKEFWTALKDIANTRNRTIRQLLGEIETTRDVGNLSSAIRLFVLAHYQKSVGA
jgi:predicted DNA-binding ribbon-helix-helix protein